MPSSMKRVSGGEPSPGGARAVGGEEREKEEEIFRTHTQRKAGFGCDGGGATHARLRLG